MPLSVVCNSLLYTKKAALFKESKMNEMRKLMESVLTERPIEHGNKVEYKGKRYTVVGISLNDWNQILIQRDGTSNEGWVDINELTVIASEAMESESSTEEEEVVESDDVEMDIDTCLENLELSVANIIKNHRTK